MRRLILEAGRYQGIGCAIKRVAKPKTVWYHASHTPSGPNKAIMDGGQSQQMHSLRAPAPSSMDWVYLVLAVSTSGGNNNPPCCIHSETRVRVSGHYVGYDGVAVPNRAWRKRSDPGMSSHMSLTKLNMYRASKGVPGGVSWDGFGSRNNGSGCRSAGTMLAFRACTKSKRAIN